MSVLDKLKKASTIKESSILSKSKFFTEKDMIQTDVPMVNVALSGSLDRGITPGLTIRLASTIRGFLTEQGILNLLGSIKEGINSISLRSISKVILFTSGNPILTSTSNTTCLKIRS